MNILLFIDVAYAHTYTCTHSDRGEFAEYLRRPDHKQELLSQWQNDFNTLPVHVRREAAMKAELHCKVDVSLANTCM